jgi:hypothetical protein
LPHGQALFVLGATLVSGAAQLSPQHDEQQQDEKIAIPAETTPAANMVSAEFFMHPL